jgi:dTDP-4-dehydrorhamnose 3,5-epimerase
VKFEPTPIPGALLVRAEPHTDERGHFARIWCRQEFSGNGLEGAMVQASISYNHRAGTVRGMHYALAPSVEDKLVRCVRGAVHDVILDLRRDSSTFKCHFAVELSSASQLAIFIPHGVAHGFQTLVDDAEVLYMMTEAYRPDLAAGVNHADPAFAIRWPLPVTCISERDRAYPMLGVD